MGSSERLCLRWNDFESNIKHGFSELRQDEEFFDVTLACGSRQIKAHKVILSACSPFFRSIIKSVPHQHPLLYLRGIKFNHLESLLSFMYNGEVNVTQEELNSFLAVAEELKIKGLTQNNSNNEDVKPKSENSSFDTAPPPAKRPRPSGTGIKNNSSSSSSSPAPSTSTTRRSRPAAPPPPPVVVEEEDEIEEVTPVKSEPKDNNSSNIVVEPEMADDLGGDDYGAGEEENYDDYGQYGSESGDMSYGEGGSMMDASMAVAGPSGSADGNKVPVYSTEDLDLIIGNLYEKNSLGNFQCLTCGYSSSFKHVVKRHIESKHISTTSYKCSTCHNHYKTRHGLAEHKNKQRHF